jgi:TPR repeat protein
MTRTLWLVCFAAVSLTAQANPNLSEAYQHFNQAKNYLLTPQAPQISQGLKELKLAAEAGLAEARLLYFHLTDGTQPLERRPRVAYYWIRELAENGNASAQYFQGREYLLGKSVKADEVEAAVWFSLAAKQNHQDALKELKSVQTKWTEKDFTELQVRLKKHDRP